MSRLICSFKQDDKEKALSVSTGSGKEDAGQGSARQGVYR